MTDRKYVKIAFAMALSTASFNTSAYTGESAMNRCAAALTAELTGSNGAIPSYRLSDDSRFGPRLSETQVFHLDARDPKTGEVVARADCVVDHRARVKRLETLPLTAADSAERALSSN